MFFLRDTKPNFIRTQRKQIFEHERMGQFKLKFGFNAYHRTYSHMHRVGLKRNNLFTDA